MANLNHLEQAIIRDTFNNCGYVLDFSDATFSQFMSDFKVDIYSDKYAKSGNSKFKRLFEFIISDNDMVVGKVLKALVDLAMYKKQITDEERNNCLKIANRLMGKNEKEIQIDDVLNNDTDENNFLKQDFKDIDIRLLGLDYTMTEVIEQRLNEISNCLKYQAYLSVIFLCGSILEGILLDRVSQNPQKSNQAKSVPKDKNNQVKNFQDWTLSNLIDVVYELGEIKYDVSKYSHSLREFRNFIHPRQQIVCKFSPDKHTAIISWKVLQAALADLTKSR